MSPFETDDVDAEIFEARLPALLPFEDVDWSLSVDVVVLILAVTVELGDEDALSVEVRAGDEAVRIVELVL